MSKANIIEAEKLKTSKEDRQAVESFMGLPEGYLSEFLTWNGVMAVIEKIESPNYRVHIDSDNYYDDVSDTTDRNRIQNTCAVLTSKYQIIITGSGTDRKSKIEAVWLAVLKFINWYNQRQPDKK